jgi:drug/metabolite transporter (DMT)-like permease
LTAKPNRTALIIFISYSVLAGGNAVGVKFSNLELDPFWGATLRFSLAAALMLVAMAIKRKSFPSGRALLGSTLYGLLAFGSAFALGFYAFVELGAGFGQILLSVVPLVTLLLAAMQRQERLAGMAVAGGVLAFAGVVTMSGTSLSGDIPLRSILAALGAAICFAEASLVVRKFPPVDPVVNNAVGMTVGAVFLAALTFVAGDTVRLPVEQETWVALAYMVVIGSGVVFTLYLGLLRFWEASRANYGFVIMPVVTILVSAWLLDEKVNSGFLVGGALVLAGVYIGALRKREPAPLQWVDA